MHQTAPVQFSHGFYSRSGYYMAYIYRKIHLPKNQQNATNKFRMVESSHSSTTKRSSQMDICFRGFLILLTSEHIRVCVCYCWLIPLKRDNTSYNILSTN